MEVKEKSPKRELIKSVAIVFLVILLILTFFSNTIMNYSLAEVATQSVTSGTINARIRGSGTVEAGENYEVIIPQTREVRSISVREGDFVSEGDVLFILGDVESQELKAAQEQLDALNLQYQQQLLTLSREQAGEDRTIKVLREELTEAQRQRDENLVTAEELSEAKTALAAAESDLAQIVRTLEELNAYLSGDESYAAAKAAVSEWTGKVEAALSLIQQYEEQLRELSYGGGSDFSDKINEAQNAVSAARQALASAWTVYKSEYLNLVASVVTDTPAANSAFPNLNETTPSFTINPLQQTYIDAYLTKNAADPNAHAYTALMAAYNELQTRNDALTQLQNEQDQNSASQSSQRYAIQRKLSEAEIEYSAAVRQLEQAEYALSYAESNQAAVKEQIKSFESSQRDQNAYVAQLKDALSALESKKILYDQAAELVKQKQRAIEDALVGRDIDQQLDDLSLENLRSQIEKVQEQVEKYTAETVDAEIRASVSGKIAAIHVTAGKDAAAGSSMATIEMVDRGYVLKIPVTVEQSRQVRVGDIANVTNYYWGADVEAVLESVVADPQNPGRGKLLVFRVDGEVDAGSNLTLSIGQRSANYDTIIPKSALRQDTNGYFVLVITVKSSPLSNRYIATRVDVQVLAEDDTSAAVSGISNGDFVITTSNQPVEAGHQVRLVEDP